MAQVAGLIRPRPGIERVLDPVLKQARKIAKLNDPRELYVYRGCREPRVSIKGIVAR